jgi:hypothetical protein
MQLLCRDKMVPVPIKLKILNITTATVYVHLASRISTKLPSNPVAKSQPSASPPADVLAIIRRTVFHEATRKPLVRIYTAVSGKKIV